MLVQGQGGGDQRFVAVVLREDDTKFQFVRSVEADAVKSFGYIGLKHVDLSQGGIYKKNIPKQAV